MSDTGVGFARFDVASPSRMLERDRSFSAWAQQGQSRLRTWRRRAATGVAGVLALGMGYGVFFGHNGITAFQQKRAEEQHLKDKMRQLQHENTRLRGHVERLGNDPGAVEHQAREELHYTRSGEVIYTLGPEERAASPEPPR